MCTIIFSLSANVSGFRWRKKEKKRKKLHKISFKLKHFCYQLFIQFDFKFYLKRKQIKRRWSWSKCKQRIFSTWTYHFLLLGEDLRLSEHPSAKYLFLSHSVLIGLKRIKRKKIFIHFEKIERVGFSLKYLPWTTKTHITSTSIQRNETIFSRSNYFKLRWNKNWSIQYFSIKVKFVMFFGSTIF